MVARCSRCGRKSAFDPCRECGSEPPAPIPASPPIRSKNPLRRGIARPERPTSLKAALLMIGGMIVSTGVLLALSHLSARRRMRNMQLNAGVFDDTVTIAADDEVAWIVVSADRGSYVFEVTPIDGPVLMAVGQLDEGDSQEIRPQDIQSVLASAITVQPGIGRKAGGDYVRGRLLWVVANPSVDRPVQAAIRFRP